MRGGEVSVVDFAKRDDAETAVSIIKITAPKRAKVFLGDQLIQVAEYRTPALSKDVQYSYVFRAELTRDGKTSDRTQKVIFKGGEPVTVDFTELNVVRTVSSR